MTPGRYDAQGEPTPVPQARQDNGVIDLTIEDDQASAQEAQPEQSIPQPQDNNIIIRDVEMVDLVNDEDQATHRHVCAYCQEHQNFHRAFPTRDAMMHHIRFVHGVCHHGMIRSNIRLGMKDLFRNMGGIMAAYRKSIGRKDTTSYNTYLTYQIQLFKTELTFSSYRSNRLFFTLAFLLGQLIMQLNLAPAHVESWCAAQEESPSGMTSCWTLLSLYRN